MNSKSTTRFRGAPTTTQGSTLSDGIKFSLKQFHFPFPSIQFLFQASEIPPRLRSKPTARVFLNPASPTVFDPLLHHPVLDGL